MMKKILMCVFSGTGNTRKIANLFSDEFIKNGVETTIVDIKKARALSASTTLTRWGCVIRYTVSTRRTMCWNLHMICQKRTINRCLC